MSFKILKFSDRPSVFLSEHSTLGVTLTIFIIFRVISIETNHLGQIFDGSPNELRNLMEQNGYDFYKKVEIDEIYVRNEEFYAPKHAQNRPIWQVIMSLILLISLIILLLQRYCCRFAFHIRWLPRSY
jgi:hypothetical protein